MPSSKKGRISGTARKEINAKRAADATSGRMEGVIFGRVTKMLGANHVTVCIDAKHGPKDLRARIPNILARRGATPVTVRDVVALEVGKDFDPDDKENPIRTSDLFDIKAILTNKQVYALQKAGEIPLWMSSESADAAAASKEGDGFEFDHSAIKEEGDDEDDEKSSDDGTAAAKARVTMPAFSRKDAFEKATGEADDLDVDNI